MASLSWSGSVSSIRKNSAPIERGSPWVVLAVIMRVAGSVIDQHHASVGMAATTAATTSEHTSPRSTSALVSRSTLSSKASLAGAVVTGAIYRQVGIDKQG